MRLPKRIHAFSQLGQALNSLSSSEWQELCRLANQENPWFTSENIRMALTGITSFLTPAGLQQWTSSYDLEPASPCTIGVAMAGNIPIVGFHDFLSVLISGHRLSAKLSTQDSVLLKAISNRLVQLEPEFKGYVFFEDRLANVDAVIATGGNNTARYFEYAFRNIPRIIRKNRSSCAVVTGDESMAELAGLGLDIFSYFGLGCRNVSKIFVPEGYDLSALLTGSEKFRSVLDHRKYAHNYTYQKSILQINKIPFFDNGFVLLRNDASFVSPISVLYYEMYSSPEDLLQQIARHHEELQCIVSAGAAWKGSYRFGEAQFPKVSDYADNVDTLKFLEGIGKATGFA